MHHSLNERLIANYDPSNFVTEVYVHSKAPNADFYDLMWKYQSSEDHSGEWGKNRIPKFFSFLGGQKFWPKQPPFVLDMACGLGRFSIASLELGAEFVVACDGSFVGPKYTRELISKDAIPQNQFEDRSYRVKPAQAEDFGGKLLPIQVDIEEISTCFAPNSFDLVFIHMALHHVGNPQNTLGQLANLVTEGGLLAINFFTVGTTSSITYELREFFLNEPMERVRSFLIAIHRIEIRGSEQEAFSFDSFLADPKYLPEFSDYKEVLGLLSAKHGVDAVYDHLRWEDMQTPHLHNLQHTSIADFLTKSLELRIVNQDNGRILARKKGQGLLKTFFGSS